MPISDSQMDDLNKRFNAYQSNDSHQNAVHAAVRARVGELAEFVTDIVPDGREKSLALTKLEEAMFWTNAGVARSSA